MNCIISHYTCVFTMIRIKRFNEDILNETVIAGCLTHTLQDLIKLPQLVF